MSDAITASSPRRRLWWLWLAISAAVLTAYFYAPATDVLDVTLDSSNYGSYSAFTAGGYQYGPQVVPMAGPYGFVLYGTTYGGHLYWDRFLLELLVKAAFALLLLWIWSSGRGSIARWLWLAFVIVVLPGSELNYDFAVLLGGLYVVLNFRRPRRLGASCALLVLLALLSLSKGTLLVFTGATLGLVALQAIAAREFRRLAWLAGTYLIALLAWWTAAGQQLSHLPEFVRGINELSRGYNEVMGLQEAPAVFATGAASLALFFVLLAVLAWRRRGDLATALALLLMGGFAFLKWKHGFVRADGHVYLFYYFIAVAAPLAWLVARGTGTDQDGTRPSLGLTAAVLALLTTAVGYYGPGGNPWSFFRWQLGVAATRVAANAANLATPLASKAALIGQLQENRATFALPTIDRWVGQRSIDFFGIEHGYLELNRLNYQPRPMSGGSFNVFTPYLQERNARYVSDPARRPDFYLVNLQTIDQRLLTEDDASALLALIHGYTPVAAEQGMLLLEAASAAPAAPPRVIEERAFRFGEPVTVPRVGPDELLLVSFQFAPSFTGRLRAALYKPSELYLELGGRNLNDNARRRIAPTLTSLPVLLDPVLESTADLLALYAGDDRKDVQSFKVSAQLPGNFATTGNRVTFYATRRPAPISAERRAALAPPLLYPMANRVPAVIEPYAAPYRMKNGLMIQPTSAPAHLGFRLSGNERAIEFDYGLDPECYLRGETDGVEFEVELTQPGAGPQLLFRRLLRPRTVAADRGRFTAKVVLPPVFPPNTLLTLRAGPGPDGNNAWDWAYYTRMRIVDGAFLREQFPGFNVAPSAVAADYCGPMTEADGRTVFMLNAAGRVSFDLRGPETRVEFAGGLIAGSYLQGDTDGAEFVVELHRSDGRTEELFRRWLQPKTEPRDRGDQDFVVPLPAHAPGDRLDVRTLPGPHGNLAWDWTYLARLNLQ